MLFTDERPRPKPRSHTCVTPHRTQVAVVSCSQCMPYTVNGPPGCTQIQRSYSPPCLRPRHALLLPFVRALIHRIRRSPNAVTVSVSCSPILAEARGQLPVRSTRALTPPLSPSSPGLCPSRPQRGWLSSGTPVFPFRRQSGQTHWAYLDQAWRLHLGLPST